MNKFRNRKGRKILIAAGIILAVGLIGTLCWKLGYLDAPINWLKDFFTPVAEGSSSIAG